MKLITIPCPSYASLLTPISSLRILLLVMECEPSLEIPCFRRGMTLMGLCGLRDDVGVGSVFFVGDGMGAGCGDPLHTRGSFFERASEMTLMGSPYFFVDYDV